MAKLNQFNLGGGLTAEELTPEEIEALTKAAPIEYEPVSDEEVAQTPENPLVIDRIPASEAPISAPPMPTPMAAPRSNLTPEKVDYKQLLNQYSAAKRPTAYREELDNSALKTAIEDSQQNQLMNNLARIGSQIGGSIANVKNDMSTFDALDKSANNPVEMIQGLRKGKDAELARESALMAQDEERSLSDPMSVESKMAREAVKGLVPKAAGLPDNVSAKQLYKLFPLLKSRVDAQKKFQQGGIDENGEKLIFDPETGSYQSSGKKAKQDLFQVRDNMTGATNLVNRRAMPGGGMEVAAVVGGAKERTGEETSPTEMYKTLDVKQRERLDKARTAFLTDTKDDRDAINAAQGVRTMINAGGELNGDIMRAIQNQLARSSGERGAMTENDVAGFGGRADALSRLKRIATMQTVGKLPEADRKFLSDISKIMEKKSNQFVENQSKVYTDNFANDVGIDPSKARGLMGVDSTLTTPTSGSDKNVNEERRKTKDGKTAIFDSKTKKFLRYE